MTGLHLHKPGQPVGEEAVPAATTVARAPFADLQAFAPPDRGPFPPSSTMAELGDRVGSEIANRAVRVEDAGIEPQ